VGSDDQALLESFRTPTKGWVTDRQRVQVMVLLGLVGPEEIAEAAGTDRATVVEDLGLRPYLP
jgi:hypothetical protein